MLFCRLCSCTHLQTSLNYISSIKFCQCIFKLCTRVDNSVKNHTANGLEYCKCPNRSSSSSSVNVSAAESRFLRAFGLVDTGGVIVSSRHRIGTTRQQPAAVGCHASSRTLLPFVVHDDAFCKFAKCSPSRRVLRLESYYIAPTPPLSRSIKVTASRKRSPNLTQLQST